MNELVTTLLAAILLTTAGDRELEGLLKRSAYPLGDAIAKALEIARTGVVLSAELEEEDGRAVYSVEIAQGRKTLEVVLDARTGELVEKALEDDDQDSLAGACKISLARAIEIAKAKVSGQAFAAEAERDDDKPVLEVKLLGDGKVHKVKIDPATGEVLKVRSRNVEGEKK